MLATVCSSYIRISQSMPVLPPEDDRRTSASARSCYDAGMPRGDNGAAAHARGQDLWQARRIDNGRVQSDALDTEKTPNSLFQFALHAASSNSNPVIAVSPRAVLVRSNPAEPDPRAASAAAPDRSVSAAPYKYRAQCHLGEDTRRWLSVSRSMLKPIRDTSGFELHATIERERRATLWGKETKTDWP